MTYLKIGGLVAVFLAGCYLTWSYENMETKLHEAQIQKEVAEAKLVMAEKTIKIFKEWDDAEKIIGSTDDPDLIEFFHTGVLPDRPKASNRPTTLPKQAPPRVDETGQK